MLGFSLCPTSQGEYTLKQSVCSNIKLWCNVMLYFLTSACLLFFCRGHDHSNSTLSVLCSLYSAQIAQWTENIFWSYHLGMLHLVRGLYQDFSQVSTWFVKIPIITSRYKKLIQEIIKMTANSVHSEKDMWSFLNAQCCEPV